MQGSGRRLLNPRRVIPDVHSLPPHRPDPGVCPDTLLARIPPFCLTGHSPSRLTASTIHGRSSLKDPLLPALSSVGNAHISTAMLYDRRSMSPEEGQPFHATTRTDGASRSPRMVKS